jgi:hypothetical protein
MMPTRGAAEKFLKILDPNAKAFTFQIFHDLPSGSKTPKDDSLSRIIHGSLEDCWDGLCELNKRGAGVYVTINETDLKGREAKNVKRIRGVFVDLDGAPLEPAMTPTPHIVTESSPKRWHVIWRVQDMPLDAEVFRNAQRRLINRLKSDKKITDLPRVLRLPGFIHHKGKPFLVRIVKLNDFKSYKASQFIDKNAEPKRKVTRINNRQPVEQADIQAALDIIASDDYQIWFEVGCALLQELGDEGFELFDRWSRKSEKYEKTDCRNKWKECKKVTKFTAGTIFHYAAEVDANWKLGQIPSGAAIDDFVSFLPSHKYVYLATGQSWPATSVNARLPKQLVEATGKRIAASAWLDRFRKAEAMTWSPGDPELIPDRVARTEGGWIEKPDTTCLNLYRPPRIKPGDPQRAWPWVDHVHKLYPDDAEHILDWFAQRVQFPGIKINHGLLLAGEQGIGKDMSLKPLRQAIGDWNWINVAPKDIMGSFNAHVKSVVCHIDEARDLGDTRHYDFYEHLKTLTTAPPDILQCNEKHLNKYAVVNVTGIIITTNHRTGGIYLPPGDRRFYVAWSNKIKEEFKASFFTDLEAFYNDSGYEHVAAWLRSRNLSKFNPKAPPKQTEAFFDIVEASLPMEDAEFAEALNILERPQAVTVAQINKATPSGSFAKFLEERRNARAIPHRLESCGYIAVRNPGVGHNRWQFRILKNGKTTMHETAIYVLRELSPAVRIQAARALIQKYQDDSRNT